jgi:multiple sugar transport system permease protein
MNLLLGSRQDRSVALDESAGLAHETAGGARSPRAWRVRQARQSRAVTYTSLVLPSFALLILINAYPLVYAVKAVLHNGSLLSPGDFVGMRNFQSVLHDDVFWQAVRFTLVFTVAAVLGSWLLGLGLALVLRVEFPGRSVLRVLLLLPWVVPVVVTATSWLFLVGTTSSPLPRLAKSLGFGDVLFVADPKLAAVTLIVFKVWTSFPFMLLMMGAALQNIDKSVYEAASLDGAGPWQRLIHITLPLIARPTYISWILAAIFAINDFPTVWLLTGGGPVNSTQTLIVYAYNLVFYDFKPGLGVAVAFLMTVVMVLVSVVLFRFARRSFVAN